MIKKDALYPVKKYGKLHYSLSKEIAQLDLNDLYVFLIKIKNDFSLTTIYLTQVSENNYLVWANIYGKEWSFEHYRLTLGTIKFNEFYFMQLNEIESSKENKKAFAFSVDQLCLEVKKTKIRDRMKMVFAS